MAVRPIGGGGGVRGSCSQVFHPYHLGFRPRLYDLWQPIYVGNSLLLVSAQHVRTDVFYGSWSPRTQGIVDSIVYVLLFLPGMAFFCWLGFEYFYESWLIREVTTHSPWRQIIYPFKAAIPLAMGLLTLQGIAELVKSIRRVRGLEVPTVVPEVTYDES